MARTKSPPLKRKADKPLNHVEPPWVPLGTPPAPRKRGRPRKAAAAQPLADVYGGFPVPAPLPPLPAEDEVQLDKELEDEENPQDPLLEGVSPRRWYTDTQMFDQARCPICRHPLVAVCGYNDPHFECACNRS